MFPEKIAHAGGSSGDKPRTFGQTGSRAPAEFLSPNVHEHPRDAKQSIVSGFKIKIAPVHSNFDVAFFPLSLMGFAD